MLYFDIFLLFKNYENIAYILSWPKKEIHVLDLYKNNGWGNNGEENGEILRLKR